LSPLAPERGEHVTLERGDGLLMVARERSDGEGR
jgi:hypothetical protein